MLPNAPSSLCHAQNYLYVLGADPDVDSSAAGDALPQIFWDAFVGRTGSGVGAVVFLLVIVVGVQLCAHSTHTYIARWVVGSGWPMDCGWGGSTTRATLTMPWLLAMCL